MHLRVSPGPIVPSKIRIFSGTIFGVNIKLKFENFSKTMQFEFLSFSKTLLFGSSITFKRTQGTSIPSDYFNFTKTTNKLIVSNITRSFETYEMLNLEINQ